MVQGLDLWQLTMLKDSFGCLWGGFGAPMVHFGFFLVAIGPLWDALLFVCLFTHMKAGSPLPSIRSHVIVLATQIKPPGMHPQISPMPPMQPKWQGLGWREFRTISLKVNTIRADDEKSRCLWRSYIHSISVLVETIIISHFLNTYHRVAMDSLYSACVFCRWWPALLFWTNKGRTLALAYSEH